MKPAKRHRRGHGPVLSERMFLESLLCLDRTGVPWGDLLSYVGAWDAMYNRSCCWLAYGSMARLFERLTDGPQLGDVGRMLIDSPLARPHMYGTGARPMYRGGEAHCVGRSLDGFTSKILMTATDENTIVVVEILLG